MRREIQRLSSVFRKGAHQHLLRARQRGPFPLGVVGHAELRAEWKMEWNTFSPSSFFFFVRAARPRGAHVSDSVYAADRRDLVRVEQRRQRGHVAEDGVRMPQPVGEPQRRLRLSEGRISVSSPRSTHPTTLVDALLLHLFRVGVDVRLHRPEALRERHVLVRR